MSTLLPLRRLARTTATAAVASTAAMTCALVTAVAAGGVTRGRVHAAEATTALPLAPGWTTTALLASPHATQAAAADERRVYAISSTTVAEYARPGGHLVRTATTSDTRHLNSGFVHEGKLLCAHSNYPHEPHESDIRVYDPATGLLDVLHRFEHPPGSLVWCVARDGAWWCCFAHYGDRNADTLLVEYAPGGFDREVRRFTFPPEVVADWDGMSASGGIWDGDTLLVSHHHVRVLYRLRLPEAGDRLELVEALDCPFPGQGIAADPATGGLVGIDRPGRRVVFAVPVEAPAALPGRK